MAADSVSKEVIEQLKGVTTATVSMLLLKRGIRAVSMHGPRRVAGPKARLVGPATTLQFFPFREDLFDPAKIGDPESAQRRVIEQTPEGGVLVIGTGGRSDNGTLGDILTARLKVRGVAGMVTDGAVRDIEGIRPLDFPIFAGGVAPPATYNGFCEGVMNGPVACGGVTVLPGDIIVADEDGALVLPRALAAKVAEAGVERERLEGFLARRVRQGASTVGTYPPDEATLAAYKAWVEAGEPEE